MSGRVRQADAPEALALERLRVVWRRWTVAGFGLLVAAALALRPAAGDGLALWLLVDSLCLVGVLLFIWSRLPENKRAQGGQLLSRFGAGNHVTVLRGVLLAQLPGYLLLPWPTGPQAWLPALTFSGALVGDFVDGYLARRANAVTGFGSALDIEFDGLGLMAATALAVHYGQLPLLYFLTAGVARYVYLFAGWLARRLGRPTRPLPESSTRRGLGGVSMELASAALWPIAPPEMMRLGAAILAVPFLSGFLRDGLIHLGLLDPAWTPYVSLRRVVVGAVADVLPVGLRAALAAVLGPWLVGAATGFPGVVEAARRAGIGAAEAFVAIVLGVSALSLVLIVAGAAGRTGAVGLLVVYGLFLALVELSPIGLTIWGLAVGIFLVGTGRLSIWQPERSLYQRQAGARS